MNLSEAIALTVISKDELGKKKQVTRMVTRSRNSPGIVGSQKKAPSIDLSPRSFKKREMKNRQKEKENINLNQRSESK
jgi:hypothetical protein